MKGGVLIYASCPQGTAKESESKRNLKKLEKSS